MATTIASRRMLAMEGLIISQIIILPALRPIRL